MPSKWIFFFVLSKGLLKLFYFTKDDE